MTSSRDTMRTKSAARKLRDTHTYARYVAPCDDWRYVALWRLARLSRGPGCAATSEYTEATVPQCALALALPGCMACMTHHMIHNHSASTSASTRTRTSISACGGSGAGADAGHRTGVHSARRKPHQKGATEQGAIWKAIFPIIFVGRKSIKSRSKTRYPCARGRCDVSNQTLTADSHTRTRETHNTQQCLFSRSRVGFTLQTYLVQESSRS